MNFSNSGSGDFYSLDGRLLQLQRNPLDVLSIINNSIGQIKRNSLNTSQSINSKYVSDLKWATRRDDHFSVLQLNTQGLCSSIDQLRQIVFDGRPDVIGLCETFLNSSNEMLLDIPGYKMERLNRRRMAKGGLVMYISDIFPYTVRSDLSRNDEGVFESQFIEIKLKNKVLIIGNVYRSPSGSVPSFLQVLDEVLDLIGRRPCELVIMGDFNLNLIDMASSTTVDFLSDMLTAGVLPTTCIPTRVTDTSASLIDNIFSSLNLVRNSVVVSDISDHFPVFSSFILEKTLNRDTPASASASFRFGLNELIRLRSHLAEKTWNIFGEDNDFCSKFDSFYESVKESIFDVCALSPSTSRSKRSIPLNPWMTPGLLKSWRRKNNLWKAFKSAKPSLNAARLQQFKLYRNVFNSLCRKAKFLYYSKKFSDCGKDIRKTWQVINSVLKRSSPAPSIPPSLVVGDVVVEGIPSVQEAFTSYFANIGKTTASSVRSSQSQPDYKSYLGPPCLKSMVLYPASVVEVARIVNSLKGSSSSGPDCIPTMVVKFILPSIISPLTKLINLSFENGIFPSSLKRARVIVLYKGGPRNDPANYRPISLLSVFSKIFEKTMLSRLLAFLEAKRFFHDFQFGFRAKHSTEHACVTLLNFLHTALDSGLIPAAIFLDVRKAFDSLTHEILLYKLSHNGVRGQAHAWFDSYLSGRTISVDSLSRFSSEVEFGVPQGSVLGPFLFLIYVNDLIVAVMNQKPTVCCRLCHPESFNAKKNPSFSQDVDTLVAFADDSTIGTVVGTESEMLPKLVDLFERVVLWFDANCLALNVAKSSFLIFSRISLACPELTNIQLSRGSLSRPKERYVRFLGILLDENLSFKHHIGLINMKISRSLGILRKLKHIFPGSVLKILFHCLVQSYVSYCPTIWMSTFSSFLKPLSKLYDKARRLIQETNCSTTNPTSLLLDLQSLYILSCASFTFHQIHGDVPTALQTTPSFVTDRSSHHLRNSRNINILFTPSVRSDFNPLTACHIVWNSLPESAQECHSFGTFKRILRNFLMS